MSDRIPHHLVEILNRCDWWQRPKALMYRPPHKGKGREPPSPQGEAWYGQRIEAEHGDVFEVEKFANALRASPAKIDAGFDMGGIYIQHEQLPELAASGVRFARIALADPEIRVVKATRGRARKQ